jgi:hypothetical protein
MLMFGSRAPNGRTGVGYCSRRLDVLDAGLRYGKECARDASIFAGAPV